MLRMLGQSEFGLYSLVTSVVTYLTILDFGFGNAVIRYTAKFRAQGKQKEQYELFGMFFILYLCIGIIAFILGLGLYFNIDRLFSESMPVNELGKARIMLMLLIFNVTVTFPLSIFGSIITAYENFVFQRVINIARIMIYPCIMIPLLLMGYKAIGMVVLATILNILSLSINVWYCFTRLRIKVYFKNFNLGLLKEISGYSFFIFLGIIVDRIYWNSGQFILGIVAGTSAVAIYSIAIQFQTYYLNFSLAISGVFLPKITSMITNNSTEKEVSDLFIRTGRIQYIILTFLLSGFIFFGKSFILKWAGVDYKGAYLMAVIIMVPLTFTLIQNLGIIILQARNQLKFRSILYIIIASSGLAISIPLARVYQGVGCAIGISLALIVGNLIIMNIYYYKFIHIDIPRFWKEILNMSWPIIIMIFVGVTLNTLHPINNVLALVVNIIIFTMIYLPLIWLIGMNQFERNLVAVPIKKAISKIRSHHTMQY